MKSRIVLPILLLAGCGSSVTEPMPDIPETVQYETVRVEYGTSDLLPEQQAARQQPLVGEASQLALLMQSFVKGTNRAIYEQLTLVDQVSENPPTQYADGVWTWEYATAADYVRLEIKKTGADTYAYSFVTGDVKETALPIFEGWFERRQPKLLRQSGTGILRLHLNNIRQQDAPNVSGEIIIAFRAVGGVRQVRTFFYEFAQGDEAPMTAAYDYVQLRNGQGRFRYSARQDFKEDGEPYEIVSFNGAWTTEQAGRVAVRIEGGSLEVNEVLLDECWDPLGVTTFADAKPDLPSYDGGDESGCDMALRDLSLAAPEFLMPIGDPAIPDAHPDEEP